ncbi:hypothetical protein AURDEDRAFT_117133 [Auricularia subglabra TFB-10046 SS5]|uniref:Uncharacterized protein n=1 Tax=Auricularia subglabra (strain TFB-10046 / SS5) TaxID=717982 RepID=J0LFT3_AURST|nr:hypothetical protein AURDEDRAFT_117133 [Auricularia subglabra TFB-10046 SS5]
MELLSALPNIRVFEWRRSFFNGFAAFELALTELLAAHLHTLTDCTIHCPRPQEHYSAVSITFEEADAFSALRTLSISGHMLHGLARLPPSLVALDVVDFTPTGPGRNSQRAAVLEPAHVLRYRAQLWRECSPSLRQIRLWDRDLARGQLRVWGIAAFLLRYFLSDLDIDLAVNLLLKAAEEEAFRNKFGRQEHIRRLLWKDVL